MKRVSSCFVVLVFCGASWGGHGTVVIGEISDSRCALNVHSKTSSRQEMTATHAVGTTSAECVRTCVKQMGGQYVLPSLGKVYRLDRQELADKFAGEKVRLNGEVGKKSGTIKLEAITPES